MKKLVSVQFLHDIMLEGINSDSWNDVLNDLKLKIFTKTRDKIQPSPNTEYAIELDREAQDFVK